jgi:methylphosphotriester-DNA--protein-cysteine methyltransferase
MKTRIFCPSCSTVRRVADFFPNKEALLECGHRRVVIDQAVMTAYEQEVEKEKARVA